MNLGPPDWLPLIAYLLVVATFLAILIWAAVGV